MTERQRKMRLHDMQFTFWNNAISRFAKSAKSVSTQSLSLRSMRNCSGTGGLKDQCSWNNSFATLLTKGISGSHRRVNIWPAAHPTQQIVEPAASTWGENGHLAVWLDPSNAWIYPQLNAAALRMCELAERYTADASNVTDTCDRVLKQLARELLLAQSSDWAFLMKTGTAREYATQRTIDHLARFNRLHDQLVANNLNEKFLRDCEWRDNIFPNVNWRYYA